MFHVFMFHASTLPHAASLGALTTLAVASPVGAHPKFTPDSDYPADAHSAGAALAALAELKDLSADALPLAQKIAHWSLENLRDPRGFYYYQRRRTHTVRTPYMRWSQAWMLYGLAKLLETM